MMWVPQTEGSPAIKANSARAYWPGGRYVDWVGTDFYSRFPPSRSSSASTDFKASRSCSPSGRCGAPTTPASSARFFIWIASNRVADAALQPGRAPGGPFRLDQYPRSRKLIRAELRKPRHRGRP